MTALILDSRCAADSAREAIELCMGTLIPLLLPLFVLSAMTALILDSRCAADSAREAIELCIDTLIPVLFPCSF